MKEEKKSEIHFYPPVVTVLGHVDHGKTTLLDAVRKTTIAQKEHGGITQNIGASRVTLLHEGKKRDITFIDTPGHQAFSNMRSRGATAADIGLLVVSAVDGVAPQTQESITLLKNAAIPFIVVLTKSDVPTKNIEKVKQQLSKEEVLLEGYGGSTPVIEVSARNNTNIKELLELILLVFDMRAEQKHISEAGNFEAIVIESKHDTKVGARATIVVKNGVLNVREDIVCEDITGRVKALIDYAGIQQKRITIGDAVEILGFDAVPPVGGIVKKKGQAQVIKKEVEHVALTREMSLSSPVAEAPLSIIICADTQGALEAILYALPETVKIMTKKTGEVSEADVLLAKSVGAIILSFNTKVRSDVTRLAEVERVLLRNYTIIYELLDEVADVLEGKKLALIEELYGKAKVLASFPFEKTKVLGVLVLEGRVAKGDKVRLLRGEEIIGESHVQSVRRGKDQISKVEKGTECGVIISPLLDFTIGDVLISHG